MATTTTFEDHVKGGKTVKITCGVGETSAALLAPAGEFGYLMTPAAGNAKVQYSRSGQAAILASTGDIWTDVAAAGATPQAGTLIGVSAVRLVATTGTAILEVRLP